MSIFLFTLLVLSILVWWYRSRKYFHPVGFPTGPFQWPIVGNLFSFRKSPLKAMTKWKNQYGKIVGARLGDMRVVIINDYEWIRDAFTREEFNGRPEFKPAHLFAGGDSHGTLTSDGDPWDTIRRFTMKHLNILGFGKKNMEGFIQDDVGRLIYSLEKEASKGRAIDFKDKFYLTATNHLWYILTGKEIPDTGYFQKSLVSLNMALWRQIGSSIWFLPWIAELFPRTTGLSQLKEALPNVQSLVKTEVQDHRKRLKSFNQGIAAEDLMSAFLTEIENADGDPSSHFHKQKGENHMFGMILNLFVTAGEAVTNTLNWSLLYLSLYPEVQDCLAREIENVIGPIRTPCFNDLASMPYTKAVMQEILRISSTSPFSNFQLTTKDVNFRGYNIPKDTVVIANLYGIHHDEELYPEPELFSPDRFLDIAIDPKGGRTHSNSPLIPFSVGLRTCPGQTFAKNEFFLLLSTLCQNFKFEWDPTVTRPSGEDLTEKCHVSIFRFTPQFRLFVTRRETRAPAA